MKQQLEMPEGHDGYALIEIRVPCINCGEEFFITYMQDVDITEEMAQFGRLTMWRTAKHQDCKYGKEELSV